MRVCAYLRERNFSGQVTRDPEDFKVSRDRPRLPGDGDALVCLTVQEISAAQGC